jgi:hypothetical protein
VSKKAQQNTSKIKKKPETGSLTPENKAKAEKVSDTVVKPEKVTRSLQSLRTNCANAKSKPGPILIN